MCTRCGDFVCGSCERSDPYRYPPQHEPHCAECAQMRQGMERDSYLKYEARLIGLSGAFAVASLASGLWHVWAVLRSPQRWLERMAQSSSERIWTLISIACLAYLITCTVKLWRRSRYAAWWALPGICFAGLGFPLGTLLALAGAVTCFSKGAARIAEPDYADIVASTPTLRPRRWLALSLWMSVTTLVFASCTLVLLWSASV